MTKQIRSPIHARLSSAEMALTGDRAAHGTRRGAPRRSRAVRTLLIAMCLLTSSCHQDADETEVISDANPNGTQIPKTQAAILASTSIPHRSAEQSAQSATCPPDMAQVAEHCIDRYEAHVLVRSQDGSLAPHPAHAQIPPGAYLVAASDPGVLPQAYINRLDAARACENAGKRLCSVVEWYRACRGSHRTVYPYGANYQAGRCNVGKAHLLSRLYGKNPRAWQYQAHFNNPILDQLPGFLARTGEFEGCVNDYGIHDMVGNLHEWVGDRVDRSLTKKLPLRANVRRTLRPGTGHGIFMGGFFSTTNQHGRGCRFVTIAHEPSYHDYSTGFRCCRDL